MGQRTPTETLFGIIAAFVEHPTWSQADLARKLETRPETIRKRLAELKAGGFKLERSEDHPHVYWSVPKNWFPGAVLFSEKEVPDLLRLLGRAPRGPLRDKILGLVVSRLSSSGHAAAGADFDPAAVRSPAVEHEEERWLSVAEDAVSKKIAMKMRYYTASRRNESWRHVSVHRVDLGPRPHFIATCHKASELRRFRMSNVLEARLDKGEKHRPVDADALRRFDEESFGGFRNDGPAVACAFVVRDEDASWVARNLPDDRMTAEAADGGTRFRVKTSAVKLLARFVAGLGDAATPESPELADAVAKIARGALANAASGLGAS